MKIVSYFKPCFKCCVSSGSDLNCFILEHIKCSTFSLERCAGPGSDSTTIPDKSIKKKQVSKYANQIN